MDDGVDHHLELTIPLSVQQQQAQTTDAGEENVVLAVRSEQIGQGELPFKIGQIDYAGFLLLVPKRQRHAEPMD